MSERMDNEFQWRSQMRKLGSAVEPERDLWPAISARIAQAPRRSSRRHEWPRRLAALAATVVIASGAGLMAWHLDRSTSPPPLPDAAYASADATAAPRTALDWAPPADPKLAAAAQTLDQASVDLQAALDAHPDAVFLVSMINRTNAQRMRLIRQSNISG